jgi:glutathione S-transferase
VEVLSAVADRLRASPGRFFFGDRPSSLDALLFGHLAFYRHSPVAAPVLRDKVRTTGWQPAADGRASRESTSANLVEHASFCCKLCQQRIGYG